MQQPLILVVDDSEKNLKLARDVLGADGIRTLGASTGSEAIALAAEELPDVILLDLNLPDMSGIEVARILGQSARTARIPVVALSALRAGFDDGWLLDAGLAGYLEKPIDVGRFPSQIRGYAGDVET